MTTDLRLVPAALAAWATAWALTSGRGQDDAAALVLRLAGPGLAVTAILLAVVALLRGRRPVRRLDSPAAARSAVTSIAAHALIALGVVAVTALSVQVHQAGSAPVKALAADRADAVLTGRVITDARPAAFGAGETWTLSAGTITARAATSAVRARVEVTTSAPAPAYGSTVVVDAHLSPARPGDAPAARASAGSTTVVRAPPAAVRATNTMRAALLDVTVDLAPQAQGLVPGIAVGDTSRLPDDLGEAFRATGLTHLTAVSGGHFAVVIALLTAFAGLVRAPRWVRVVMVAGIATGFVALVRPDPSVQRAAAMCAVTLIGITLGRPAASLPSLSACAVVLLAVDPWLARSFGFALSCVATAGLVLLAPPLIRLLSPWIGRPAAFAVAVPIAAQLACGPVLVLLSPALPTTSVLANLLAAPAVAPATLLGLAATLTAAWLPSLAYALAWFAGGATWWIAGVARWCAVLPGASLPWPGGVIGALSLTLATAAALLVILRRPPGDGWPVSWTDTWRRRWRSAPRDARAVAARFRHRIATRRDRRLALVAAACAAALVIAATAAAVRLVPATGGVPQDWQVVACDVGQGDALVVRTGPAAAVVVDVGPQGPAAGRCLDRLGVRTIDLLVLSHFHLDHVGGLPEVLAGRDLRDAWVSPLDVPAGNARTSRSALAAAGVEAKVPGTGAGGTVGTGPWRVDLSVIGTGIRRPGGQGDATSGSAEGDGANDASLALALTSRGPGGSLDLVLLGDLEEAGQEALLASLGDRAGQRIADGVDVVKVAHHGSASQSSGLARLLDPQVALVSVGDGNTYGHPTDRMLALYEGLGADVVRTDECGTAILVLRDDRVSLACT